MEATLNRRKFSSKGTLITTIHGCVDLEVLVLFIVLFSNRY
jgi:hypothetical protein